MATATKSLLKDTIEGDEKYYLHVDVVFDGLYEVMNETVAVTTNSSGQFDVEVVFTPVVEGAFDDTKRCTSVIDLNAIDFSGGSETINVILTDDSGNTTISGGGTIHQHQAEGVTRPFAQTMNQGA